MNTNLGRLPTSHNYTFLALPSKKQKKSTTNC